MGFIVERPSSSTSRPNPREKVSGANHASVTDNGDLVLWDRGTASDTAVAAYASGRWVAAYREGDVPTEV